LCRQAADASARGRDYRTSARIRGKGERYVGQTAAMPWYRVANAEAPWGDYGDMLYAGMLTHRDSDGVVGVERTGPFVPPIYVGTREILIATSDTRDFLEGTRLRGFHFRPTVMKHIVRLEWRHWDFKAEDPERYPAGSEPENYVLGRKHNPKVAQQIGPLWEVHVDGVLADGADADLVRSLATEYSGHLLASDRAHEVLSAEYGDWLQFDVHPL
jgi:hypothetical protein